MLIFLTIRGIFNKETIFIKRIFHYVNYNFSNEIKCYYNMGAIKNKILNLRN